jgi:hypothetical protein
MADILHDAINTSADPLGLLDVLRDQRAQRQKHA